MNISNEHLLLINILNTMYNDNNRQIQNLTNQNNHIIGIITEILHVPNSSSSNRQQNSNRQQSTSRQTNNRNRNTNNNQNSLGSLFLNNRQYIIDDIQRVRWPISGIEGRIAGNYIDQPQTERSQTERSQTERPQTERIPNVFSNLFQSFFDPVLIYPTPSQIENATRRVLYRDIVTPINNRCPISLETFNDSDTVTIIRHCGHIFNSDELNNWFRSNCRCPMCRYDIRNYIQTNLSLGINQERITTQDFSGNFIQDLSGNIFTYY
jgi:hypothetical protein